jgi:hypothetical protein
MPSPQDAGRDAPDPPGSFEERVEGWIRTMLGEPLLGPLFAVLVAHLVAFLAPVIVLAIRDRHIAALGALAILLVGSGSALLRDAKRYGRPGPLGGTLLAAWLLAGTAAWAAGHYGIL